MRSFQGSQNYIAASITQPEIYSPARKYKNRVSNTSQNNKNNNRAQQIVSLHEQFEDLKKKIKQVQNKNEKIIQKIHRQCNFKKKNPQTFDVSIQNTTPIIYYQKDKSQISQASGISFDQSNKSDQSEYEYRQRKSSQPRKSIQIGIKQKNIENTNFNRSTQYERNQQKNTNLSRSKASNNIFEGNSISSQEKISNQYLQLNRKKFQVAASQTFQNIKDYGKRSVQLLQYPSQSQTHMNSSLMAQNSQFSINIYQLEECLKIEKEKNLFLQEQLKNKQIEILNLKKSYNKIVVQNQRLAQSLYEQFENFMETSVKKGMIEIEKAIKKQQIKMKNLIINVKDAYQQHKSSKIIKQHQLRRSISRSKKDISPGHNTSVHSTITPIHPQVKIPRPSSSSSSNIQANLPQEKINYNNNNINNQSLLKKNKEFQQIVEKYEEMIGIKKLQISKLQSTISLLASNNNKLSFELNEKDRQVKQMKIKMDELERLMSETYNQIPIPKNQGSVHEKNKRRASTESNLLEDIYNFNQQEKLKESQFKQKYILLKDEVDKKDKQINKLEENIKSFEKQLKNIQISIANEKKMSHNNNSISSNSNSQKLQKQKIEQTLRKQLNEKHSIEIDQKQQEIRNFQKKINGLERNIVEKDCEIITLQNKIKKVELFNEANTKKILEYEKILNQYNQNNISVDYENGQFGMYLLEKSMCHDDVVSKSTEIQSNRNLSSEKSAHKMVLIQISQLENYEHQLQKLNEEIFNLTKKLKTSDNLQKQKQKQINKLKQELEYLTSQKQNLKMTNFNLQNKVEILQKQKFERDSDYLSQNGDEKNQDYIENQQRSIYSNISQPKNSLKLHKTKSITHHQDQVYLSDLKNIQSAKKNSLYLENEGQKKRQEQQIFVLKGKNTELSKQISHLKEEHLELSRQNISLKKNNEYLQDTLSDRQQKYEKFRREVEQLKIIVNELNETLKKNQEQLKKQRQQNCEKIIELEKQWHQFEEQINKNNENDGENRIFQNSELLRSSRFNMSQSSILISSTLHNKNSQYLKQQNEYLTIKLKQAQATIQMQTIMEQKVLNQYKKNVQKLKLQLKQKQRQNQNFKKEIQVGKDKIRRLQLISESRLNSDKRNLNSSRASSAKNTQQRKVSYNLNKKENVQSQNDDLLLEQFESYHEDNNNLSLISGEANQGQGELLYPYEKIIELQVQLKQAKDINTKLQQMSEQLFKQIKFKQEEKYDLMRAIEQKNLKIQQLEQIVQIRQTNLLHTSHLGSNLLGSHISSSNHKSSLKHIYNNISQRQSLRSQSSLRYSGISRLAPHQLNQINQSHIRASEQRFQMQLTEIGSEMLDRSYMTNISEFFEREEFPLEKAQLKRNEQIKFFEKTASYIKSLKESINEKNKKITLLEKKIDMLKQNHHHGSISKQLENKYEVSTGYRDDDIEVDFQDVFKDYESVQLQRKRINHKQMCKSLKHELKLSIQENNVLFIQIQALKTELQKAQEQEDNLVMMKDIQKNEIKQLRIQMKNQEKYFKNLLQTQKNKVQESQSVHNLVTIKQLFIKTIESFISLDEQTLKAKRQIKRKEIEEFFKIFASLTGIDEKNKAKLLESIKRLKINSVSSHGRNSSAENK